MANLPKPKSFKEARDSEDIDWQFKLSSAGSHTFLLGNGQYRKYKMSAFDCPLLVCTGAYQGRRHFVFQFQPADPNVRTLVLGTTDWTLELTLDEVLKQNPSFQIYIDKVKAWEDSRKESNATKKRAVERDIAKDYAHIEGFGDFA